MRDGRLDSPPWGAPRVGNSGLLTPNRCLQSERRNYFEVCMKPVSNARSQTSSIGRGMTRLRRRQQYHQQFSHPLAQHRPGIRAQNETRIHN